MWIVALAVAALMGHSLATRPAIQQTEGERLVKLIQCINWTMADPNFVLMGDGHDFDHCQPVLQRMTIRPRIGG